MTRTKKILLIVGWCLFALSFLPIPIVPGYIFHRAAQLVIGIMDWARNVLLALLLIGTTRWVRTGRKAAA